MLIEIRVVDAIMPDRGIHLDSRNIVDGRPISRLMFPMYGRGHLRINAPLTRDG